MARKIKGKNAAKKPPLSKLDKAIYIVGIMLGIAWGITFMFICIATIPKAVVSSDESIISYNSRISGLWCELPLIMFFWFFPGVLFACLMNAKQPIFGNKRYKPPTFAPVIKAYPLFSKEFRQNLTDEAKRKIKKTAKSILITFIVCVIIFPFGIYPREAIDKNYNFLSYNSFDQKIRSSNIKEADHLIIRITSGRRSSRRYIRMEFKFEGKTYTFSEHHFDGMTREEALKHMVYLKSFFDEDEYEIINAHLIDAYIYQRGYSNTELALVYDLLDYKE